MTEGESCSMQDGKSEYVRNNTEGQKSQVQTKFYTTWEGLKGILLHIYHIRKSALSYSHTLNEK